MSPLPTTEQERREARMAELVGHPDEFMARYRSIRSGGLYSPAAPSPAPRRKALLALERAQTRITIPEIFIDFNAPLDRRATVYEIQTAFCRRFPGITRADLMSPVRTQPLVRVRQYCMGLSKLLTGKSLPEIGRRFGGRDHTTVLHACRVSDPILTKLADQIAKDAPLDQWVEGISAYLFPQKTT